MPWRWLWRAAGVTPRQLFLAATADNAAFYGLDEEIGAIDPGKRADLLLMQADPLEDVAAYDTIEFVILGGEVIERSALSAIAQRP